MFGELPKLFGREFAIGFLLPVAVFIPASVFVINSFWPEAISWRPQPSQTNDVLLGATVFIFVLWLGGILLLALNRSIIRFKEGYGTWNPARLLAFLERRRFQRLKDRIQDLVYSRDLADSLGEERDPVSAKKRDDLKLLAAIRFPNEERLLLPTAFGNTIRAFEVYSFVMYGLDAIPGWTRLIMLMSDSSRELVESAKAQMDFWINIWLLSLLLFGEYLAGAIVTKQRGSLWWLAAIPLAWAASSRARSAAANWGELVKAAFDVYLPELREKLEIGADLAPKDEHEQWEDLSRAMVYRDPSAFPDRSKKVSGRPLEEAKPELPGDEQ